MNSIRSYFLTLFFAVSYVGAASQVAKQISDEQLFAQANEQFLQTHFEQALDLYQAMHHKNSAVFENMGNALFNQKQYARALIFWSRARMGAGWQQLDRLMESEKKALKLLGLPEKSWPHYFWIKMLLGVPLMLVQLLMVLMLLMLTYMLYRYYLYYDTINKKIMSWALVVSCLLGFFYFKQQQFMCKKEAVVVKEKVIAYAGPEKTFHSKFIIPLGAQIQVLASKQTMHQIVYGHQLGWVHEQDAELI